MPELSSPSALEDSPGTTLSWIDYETESMWVTVGSFATHSVHHHGRCPSRRNPLIPPPLCRLHLRVRHVQAAPPNPFCPRDTLKLGVCADLLSLANVVVGSPPSGDKCCPLLEGLADLEVAACLCTAIKVNVLGINLDIPVALSVLLSACQKTVPPGFMCLNAVRT
ncbi:14 kDa proline-rich protein DC2.15-like [Salvia splendens]|uniref:14 kDa proline-rich protein DC2.15-like n=1 Tax=Salvia splendens TaxID=180675 RepID=UPI001C27BC52|nr:14 kDa proline-rich protein DC2.15-like [Salvia splendens]